MADRHDYDDPGWPLALALFSFVPLLGRRLAKRAVASNLLRAMRRLIIALALSPLLLFVVLMFLRAPGSDQSAAPELAVVVVVVGVVFLVLSEYYGSRLSRVGTAAQVVGGYRAIFMLRFALSDVPALLAFVFFFLDGQALWVNLIGILITEVGLYRMAPTRSNIARSQQLLPPDINLGRLLSAPQT